MPTYYVGIGGNNANSGLTWALRKATLNGVEGVPVVAGDTVYVGAGTYREQLTCNVSGTSGSPITYIGDYDGSHTDGVGGVVRITGSDDDITATRPYGILLVSRAYRVFQGFLFDTSSISNFYATQSNNINVSNCYLGSLAGSGHNFSCTESTIMTINNCFLWGGYSSGASKTNLIFYSASGQSNVSCSVNNCIIQSSDSGIDIWRYGGITIKNTLITGCRRGLVISAAIPAGQTNTINNSIIFGNYYGIYALTVGEVTEDFNSIYSNVVSLTNTTAGAHSNAYPPLFDSRWFFELASRNQKLVSPFDLSSASQLINVAGTSPTTTDLRGQAVIGAQREWGALEYNPALSRAVGMSRGRTI